MLRLVNAQDLAELPNLSSIPLKELSLQNSWISHLPPLPRSLNRLDIAGSKIDRLSGLPNRLQALRLAPNQLTGLWGLSGLPPSVDELSFEDEEGGGVKDSDWSISVCEERPRRP